MLAKVFIVLSLLCWTGSSFGQENKEMFPTFAKNQKILLKSAYQQKDTVAYEKLLSELQVRYTQLNPEDKKKYSNYNAIALYDFCCIYSLLNEKSKALRYLEKSINAGYVNYSHMLLDSDLNNIRLEPAFKTILLPLRETGDYLYILKKAANYNREEQRTIPPFTYQHSSNPKLVALRQHFQLDSIAGFGNEVSRLLNILLWVHNTVSHNGQQESGIKQINAMEIINTTREKKIGVSCGELATVLNDCYLAMGWKSRKIYCFPKDSLHVDFDSHVIDMVYSVSLKKWIWVDPTNSAYVMNESGGLLSIEEVRNRLINDQPLIVNPDANWNHKSSTLKDYYLDNYMAKNLYRFYCPLNSEYDSETYGADKTVIYVHLLPLDYFKQSPEKTVYYNEKVKTNFIQYKTNNDAFFWKAPSE